MDNNNDTVTVALTLPEIQIILASLPRGNLKDPQIRASLHIFNKLTALVGK